jgi:membrane protein
MRLPGAGMSWKEFFVGLKGAVTTDAITDLAATVTFYGILSLFPFLLMLVALASFVISPEQAEAIVQQLGEVAPGPATQIVGERIQELSGGQNAATLVGFGALLALWSASGGTMALVGALNRCYAVREQRSWWKVRAIAVMMTIVASVLALAAALVAVAAAPLANWIGGPIGAAISWLRLPVAGIVMMFLWALIYHVLPDVEQTFKFITPGSVLGVVLWVVASWAFSRYVSSFGSYDRTYGSLGGVIVLLLWMWISSLAMLVGAEVNALIEHRSPEGKRQGAKLRSDVGLEPAATKVPVHEPVLETRLAPERPDPARARGPLRGLVAIAAGSRPASCSRAGRSSAHVDVARAPGAV